MATVLVIDDDQTTRTVIGVAVEELGHQAPYALDGDEGVEMVRSHAYDVVFMDLAMPNKNGLIAIQEIISEEYGAVKALTKPITPKQVQDTVEELLQGRPTGGWDNVKD